LQQHGRFGCTAAAAAAGAEPAAGQGMFLGLAASYSPAGVAFGHWSAPQPWYAHRYTCVLRCHGSSVVAS
jgi:hypothetical protein